MTVVWVATVVLVGFHVMLWWRVRLPIWLPLAVGLGLVGGSYSAEGVVRLLMSSAVLLYFVKLSAVFAMEPSARPRGVGAVLYHSVWPGVAGDGLCSVGSAVPDSGARFRRGYGRFLLGLVGCFGVAWFSASLSLSVVGALGIVALLLTIHLGFSDMLTGVLQCQGWRVLPLFDDPLRARSLNEFWTRRWNLAFVQMNRILFMRPSARRFGIRGAVVGSFLISGLLHELAISFPAGSGWGGPFVYFVLQVGLLGVERRFRLRGVLWTWAALLLPLPMLFHDGFRVGLVAPLFVWAGGVLHGFTFESFWSLAFLGLGAIHFVILAASAQVPSRLNWREELGRLSSLNRKLMWTYGAFIVMCILAFGVLTLVLRGEFVRGNPVGPWLCGFIAVFWGLRVVCDNFVLKFEDWPQGPEFEIGHVLLNTVFVTLTTGYGGFVMLSLMRGLG